MSSSARALLFFGGAAAAACSLVVSADGLTGGARADAGLDGPASSTDGGPGDAATDASVTSCEARGLLAYYAFDEGSGTLAHNCAPGGRYLGHLDGAVWNRPIEGSGALLFGGDAGVDLESSSGLLEEGAISFTLAATVTSTARGRDNLGRVVSKCPATGDGCKIGLELLIEDRPDGSTPSLAIRFPTGDPFSYVLRDPAPFPVDVVVAIAVAYEESDAGQGVARVYRGGDLVAESASRRRIYNNGPVSIGLKPDLTRSNGFIGTIDEVRLFSRALDACEIRQLAHKPCN